jgi:hypothetical protein
MLFPVIENYFDNQDSKAFSGRKLEEIYYANSAVWKMPLTKSASDFIKFLKDKEVLFETTFTNESNNSKSIFSWKTQDEFTTMSALQSGAYYSHYSAMFLHQLTLQIPKTYYLNYEHSSDMSLGDKKPNLTQQAIDKAFSGSQRKTTVAYSFNDRRIFIINGKKTGKLGVLRQKNELQSYQYTDLERTLIDISIRPVYAGGVFEVLEAYKKAQTLISTNKLASYLLELNFIYPYHQVIGFYLERAGYSESDLKLFEKDHNYKFYLTYDIRNKDFSERWQLYFPKGI